MRTLGLVALSAPSLLLLAASLAACEDSSGGGGGGGVFTSDAGSFEASAPADSGGSLDGSVPDGAIPGEAGAGVSVSVVGNAGPKSNVRVVFQDAAGLVIGEAKTDAAGKAFTAVAPSMVTVLSLGAPTEAQPVTFMGVADGDVLLVTPDEEMADPELGTLSVTFTAGPATVGSSFFQVRVNGGGCSNVGGGVGATVAVPMFKSCARAANSVLAAAQDASSTRAYGFAKNVTTPAGGATVNVGPLAFTAAGSRTLKATNLPAGDVSREATVYGIVGSDLYTLEASGAITEAGGLVAATPTGFADAYQVLVESGSYNGSIASTTAIVRREVATADAAATFANVDFAGALPLVTGAAASTAGAGGTARPTITVATAGVPTAQALSARMSWAGEGSSGSWTFVMPGNTKTFTVPALPADAGVFVPHDALSVDTAGYVDGTIPYGTLKKIPVNPGAYSPSLLDRRAPLPPAATVKVSAFLYEAG
ncbi:MAG: hypothetical protein JWP97_4331 [Labilithrix sp.]|nr:hypothetical protein [Labilithrix sp.]